MGNQINKAVLERPRRPKRVKVLQNVNNYGEVTEEAHIQNLVKVKLEKTRNKQVKIKTANGNGGQAHTGVRVTGNNGSPATPVVDDSTTVETLEEEAQVAKTQAETPGEDPAPKSAEDSIDDMINRKLEAALLKREEALKEKERKLQEKEQAIEAKEKQQNEDVLVDLQSQIEAAKQKLQAEEKEKLKLEQEKQQIEEEYQQTKEQIEQKDDRIKDLEETAKGATEVVEKFNSLYQLNGSQRPDIKETITPAGKNKEMQAPNVNRYTSVYGWKLEGTVAEYHQMFDKALKVNKRTKSGVPFAICDWRQLDSYVAANKEQVMKDLEVYGKRHGLLQGSMRRAFTEAATTTGDIPGGFLPILSSLARISHRAGFVFWQFPTMKLEFDKGMGDNIQIYRAAYQDKPATPNDRLLSGGGTYARISSGGDNISTGVVNALLQEWGKGKDGVDNPVEIPSFVSAYSMIELMQVLARNLLFDYYCWEDLQIRSLWAPTSRVVYSNLDRITTTATDLVANSDGTMTKRFLTNLGAYMQTQQIPKLADGCYGIVMPTQTFSNFQNDLDKFWNPPTPQDLIDFTNMMGIDLYGQSPRVDGYAGKYCDFHVFTTNAYGTGLAGTEGAQNDTLGVGATLTRTSYAFGGETIGRGVGTPMEIRRDTNDDFQRLNRFIWRSEEGFVALDVDPTGYVDTSAVPQQLRVLDVRTLDVEI